MTSFLTHVLLSLSASDPASIVIKATLIGSLALVAVKLADRQSASVRHTLLTASFAVLFLLPAASLFAPPIRLAIATTLARTTMPTPEVPFTETTRPKDNRTTRASSRQAAPGTSLPSITSLIAAVWLSGALLLILPVIAGLWQTRKLRRMALPWLAGQTVVDNLQRTAGVRRRIDILLHESIPGPMTCGIVHPAILLPIDARTWPEPEIARALIHEIEHVRRHDWLSRTFARVTCSLYWFHPLIWMQWKRFVLEAERACDDAVLVHSDAVTYADQLVVLAQRLVHARTLPTLAMADRYDLAKRVSALLDNRQRRGPAGTRWIAIACASTIALAAAISPLRIVGREQSPAPQTTAASEAQFEVAAVKSCNPGDFAIPGQRRPEFTASPGRLTINCIPLARIIYFAYAGIGDMEHPLLNDRQVDADHVRGGPGWLQTDNFVIEASAPGTADRFVMMGPMLRSLLTERFHLKTHREKEEGPMYALTVAKGGLKIQPIEDDGCTATDAAMNMTGEQRVALNKGLKPICGTFQSLGDGVNGNWTLGGTTLAKFANQVLSGVLDRYVMDKTGVDGKFNIHLTFGFDENITAGVFGGRPSVLYSAENPPPSGIERGPSIFNSLEEQLGLHLEKTRGPHEYLMIDSVERPKG